MPAKTNAPTKSTHVGKLPTAAAMIAKATAAGGTSTPPPSDAAMAELRAILAHNDSCPRSAKVPALAVIDMLRAHGWAGRSTDTLSSLCVRVLGRRSFANP